MVLISIFRHGETDWNAQRRWQGHIDVPLNDEGRRQAMGLMDPLGAQRIQGILSSDLVRARETAKIVAELMNIPVFEDAGLRECHLGEAQGLYFPEVLERFGQAALEKWNSLDRADLAWGFPGGETKQQQLDRALQAIRTYLRAHPHIQRLGVSTHGGVIRAVLAHIGGAGVVPVPIPNCAVYLLHYDRQTQEFSLSV